MVEGPVGQGSAEIFKRVLSRMLQISVLLRDESDFEKTHLQTSPILLKIVLVGLRSSHVGFNIRYRAISVLISQNTSLNINSFAVTKTVEGFVCSVLHNYMDGARGIWQHVAKLLGKS